MHTVVDLLKLPCLEQSYLVAGFNGIFNIVKRMDILETPYPEVEQFLEPNEFLFTTFWNSKNDKSNRINLVKAMIKNKCAGIGIMPEPNLNGKIDQEIIDLANEFSFPVLYLPYSIRWSDVISQFSILTNSVNYSELDSNLVNILLAFSNLHIEKNPKRFCHQLSQYLSIPIIMSVDNIYFNGVENKTVSIILSKIYSIKKQNLHKLNTPISLHIHGNNLSIVYFGNNSILATYLDSQNIAHSKLEVFHKIAPIVISELDNLMSNKPANKIHNRKISLSSDIPYYLALIRKDNISSVLKLLPSDFLVFEQDDFYNYIIVLIPKEENYKDRIFNDYNNIIEKTNPLLFIFSRQCLCTKELYSQINILKYTISSLLFLNGIFCIDELPLLYAIFYSPFTFKETVFKFNSTHLNLETEPYFFDTLRLYLTLKNIQNVSDLLGIHPNSVKYRILKCFKDEDDIHSILTDLPHIKLILLLGILKVEELDLSQYT
ncbi:MAG: hypothetical protein HPY70_05455 [Firmicutes bacterium]|jgi:hypothetical protein|nr:hypothetical protein [Bacillota bacterium]